MKQTIFDVDGKKYKLLKENALEYSMEIPEDIANFNDYDLRKESKTNIKGLKKVECWGCHGGSVFIEGFAGYHAYFTRKHQKSEMNEVGTTLETKEDVKKWMNKRLKASKAIVKSTIKIEKARVSYHEYYSDGCAKEMIENAIKWNSLTKSYDVKIVEEIDETEYLLSSEANAKHIRDSINEFGNG